MKKSIMIALALCMGLAAMAQDSTINRNITVEREFQPIIQSAGKINQRPQVIETRIEPAQVNYSDFVLSLSPDHNVTSLLSQPTRFSNGTPLLNEIRFGIGHTGTLLDVRYSKDDDSRNVLDVYANHEACWGRKALEETQLGFRFKHKFSAAEMYFGVEGSNLFYTRHGAYYDGNKGLQVEHFSQMTDSLARQSVWQGGVYMGVRSAAKGDLRYDVQAGYNAYSMSGWATEHQVRARLNFEWTSGEHHVGTNIRLQDMFYALQVELPEGKTNNSRHALFIEPYYEYVGKRFYIHVGVNLNTVFGKGHLMSGKDSTNNIAFAPSPNVHFEAQIAPKWLTVYGDARGSIGRGSMQDFVAANRYMTVMPVLYSHHVAAYTPIDAELGFHIKAHKNLLVELHAGYAYQMAQKNVFAELNGTQIANQGQLRYFYCDLDRWKVGAAISYHYQDIVNIHLWGDYYIWSSKRDEFDSYFPSAEYSYTHTEGRVYDRPDWQLGLRVDGRINNQWSLFTELAVGGSRWAATSEGDKQLAPTADWNLGCQYDWRHGLSFWLKLNNVICRYNDLYYGYKSEGTNFLLGLTWKF